MKRSFANLLWQEVLLPRLDQPGDVLELLNHLAVLSPRGQIVWEIRAVDGKVRYFVGTQRRYMKPLKVVFTTHGDIQFATITATDRKAVSVAKTVKRTRPSLSLKTDSTLVVLKSALSALAATKADETMVVQILLGEALPPSPAPDKAVNPYASLFNTICGKVDVASKECLTSIKTKANQYNFYSLIRIGAAAGNKNRACNLLLNLMSAFRQLETTGVNLIFQSTDPENISQVKIPWFLPLRLSITELAGFMLLPCMDIALPGVNGLHPKLLHPPAWLDNSEERSFAKSLDAAPIKLNIPIKDALEHTVILGPTGAGKSTVMLNLALADMKAGRGVLVIDPKADLVNDILAVVPTERVNDVVVIDPSNACPVGINPFTFTKRATPSLISDTILAIFKQIYNDSWGVYSQDVLSGALLSLAQIENATLLHLPALLTNHEYRHSVISSLNEDVGLGTFWESFEAQNHAERRQTIAPVMNKLRQFILRPALRNVLGQAQPHFTLADLFEQNKIVLVPLNKGIIGAEAARLIGSLIVGISWALALSRAKLPAHQRHPVSIFIDELQDYLALPGDFSDALAQARGLGVAFTVAHQYRAQLAPAIKAAIDANTRNKIIFDWGLICRDDMSGLRFGENGV